MVKTESELYFKILEFLSKDAFTKKQHVEGLLFDYFSRKNFYNMDSLQERINIMIIFVYNMREAGHINYNTTLSGSLTQGNLVSDSSPQKGDLSVLASITPSGFLFLNKERDRIGVKKNNRLQIAFAVITAIFIGMTALYAKLTYDLQNREILKPKESPQLNQSPKLISPRIDATKYHQTTEN